MLQKARDIRHLAVHRKDVGVPVTVVYVFDAVKLRMMIGNDKRALEVEVQTEVWLTIRSRDDVVARLTTAIEGDQTDRENEKIARREIRRRDTIAAAVGDVYSSPTAGDTNTTADLLLLLLCRKMPTVSPPQKPKHNDIDSQNRVQTS